MENKFEYSFIVPIYNTPAIFLEACIESILKNEGDFELLLIDDGSTDEKVGEICSHYADSKRIFYIKKDNSGVSSTRNFGLTQASGKWIIFVDADDLVYPHFLSEIEKSGDHDAIFFSHYTINAKGKVLSKKQGPWDLGPVWAKAFKREALLNRNMSFKQNIRYCEDSIFLLEFIDAEADIFCSDVIVYGYRYHKYGASGGSTGGYKPQCYLHFDASLKELRKYSKNDQEFYQLVIRLFVVHAMNPSIFSKGSDLSRKQKKKKLESILSDNSLVYKEAIENFDRHLLKRTSMVRIYAYCLKKRKIGLLRLARFLHIFIKTKLLKKYF